MTEQYIVSARKYRPATFASVVGQKALTATLKNAIESKRLAQAYLFTGPRGVGKTSCARIFAKTINCLSPTPDGEACGICESCKAINEGNSFNIIELDAASNNSVDNIRTLNEQVHIPPQMGNYKVFIIDEVHMLTSAAFNAFLKTLEEPPKNVVFILATTEKHKVIPTILSRCQIYDFKRITISDMVEHLQYVASQEGITADPAALNVIARKADGAMRDALSIFDQVSAYCRGNITYEQTIANLNVLDYDYYFRLVDSFRKGDVQTSLLIYKEVRDKGFDSLFFVNGLASHIRDLMVAFDPKTLSLLEVAQDIAPKYTEQARTLPIQWYYTAMRLLNDCDVAYRTASNKQFLVELTLIRLCQLLTPATPPFDKAGADIPLKDISAATAQRSESVTDATKKSSPAKIEKNPGQSSAVSNSAPEIHSATTHSTPTRKSRSTIRLGNIAAEVKASDTPKTIRREKISAEDFIKYWNEFQVVNPDKLVLISAMKSTTPVQTEPETFTATVDHPALKKAFESEIGLLLPYLRDKLNNDYLSLQININDTEIVKRLPAAELLKEIIGKNPPLAEFLNNIDAELS